MFTLKGKIQFDPKMLTKKHESQSSWKKTVLVEFNCDLCKYYTWFIDQKFNLKLDKPMRGTHFTLINDIIDDEIYDQAREMFNGKEITIQYDPQIIRSNEKGFWWLKAYSVDAQNIRSVMGLDKPYFGFHITIGLANNLYLDYSKFITNYCIKYEV